MERPQPFQEPETSDFISFGSSMQDAMYGRKYNYDMIVNHNKQKELSGNIHTNLVNMNLWDDIWTDAYVLFMYFSIDQNRNISRRVDCQ